MRFITYRQDGTDRAGVLADDDRVHPLPPGESVLGLLRRHPDALVEAGAAALADDAGAVPYDGLALRAPLPDPPTFRDFMTFESHYEGVLLVRGPDEAIPPRWYQAPAFYFSNPYSIRGPHDVVPVPPGSALFDLELEVAAVVGRAGADLTSEEAEDHIAGYAVLVDWSARDLQLDEMTVGLGPTKAKDTATTLGPWLVTPDELEPFRSGHSFSLAMTASRNGRELGTDRLDSMAWGFGDLIAYASRGTEVRPGDLIGSGTCGRGCLAELWGREGFAGNDPLAVGDEVTVTVEQLGSMTLTIGEGSAPVPVPPARTRA